MKMQPDECFGPGRVCVMYGTDHDIIYFVHKNLSTPGLGRAKTGTGRPYRARQPARGCAYRWVLCAAAGTGAEEGLGSQRYYTTIVWGTARGTLGDRGGAITLSLLKEPLVAFSSSFCLPLLSLFL